MEQALLGKVSRHLHPISGFQGSVDDEDSTKPTKKPELIRVLEDENHIAIENKLNVEQLHGN